jgi:hypothetical protein
MFPHSIIAAGDPTATIRAAPRPLAWEGREKTNDPERESPFDGAFPLPIRSSVETERQNLFCFTIGIFIPFL